MKNHHIMIIAGEASGDMRAAGLCRALKQLDPALRLSGIGGEHMRLAGVECFVDITQLAVIGIVEVAKNFSRIKKVFHQTLKQIDQSSPDCVVLVDYPGFNLRLAKEIKKRGIKIVYYISPQIWAWREKRVLKIKTLVDRMIVLFPFEKEIYRKYGMNADYVGHPLVDEAAARCSREEVLKANGLSLDKTTIGLMPGSREKEVERHLPCMLEAAQQLFEKDPKRQFLLLKASSIPAPLLEGPLREFKNLPLKIYEGPLYDGNRPNGFGLYDGINATDAVIVASGTATLECALLQKPMVIIYKTSWPTYFVAKSVIKIPYIGLANIVAGKKIAEELIQENATAEKIAQEIEKALNDPGIIGELAALRTALGQPGASLRAAKIVLETIEEKN